MYKAGYWLCKNSPLFYRSVNQFDPLLQQTSMLRGVHVYIQGRMNCSVE